MSSKSRRGAAGLAEFADPSVFKPNRAAVLALPKRPSGGRRGVPARPPDAGLGLAIAKEILERCGERSATAARALLLSWSRRHRAIISG